MLITYFRSSSYAQFSFCQQSYFLTYVLGMRSPSGLKATKGTMVHKVMECLAWAKKCKQDGLNSFQDDAFGKVYVDDCAPNNLIERSYEHYSKLEKDLTFRYLDLRDVRDWSWKCLRSYGGRFDPRRRRIIDPERKFELILPHEWAYFKYDTPEGIVEGSLGLKGTIDLITEVEPGVIEIIDWKTGKRLDWGTGDIKDYKKLSKDPQLMLYHYAATKLYPNYKQIILTIFFVNDGGCFTLCFHRSDLEKTEMMIKDRFNAVRNSRRPHLKRSWRCTAFCHFGKNNYPNSEKTICQHVRDETVLHGIDYVSHHLKASGHSIGHYEAPG